MIDIKKAVNESDICLIEHLANEIMLEHYGSYIPKSHILYFLSEFQSAEAIKKQIEGNYAYFLLYLDKIAIGNLGLEILDDKINISKFYILKDIRGRQAGKKAMEFIVEFARKKELKSIRGLFFYY